MFNFIGRLIVYLVIVTAITFFIDGVRDWIVLKGTSWSAVEVVDFAGFIKGMIAIFILNKVMP